MVNHPCARLSHWVHQLLSRGMSTTFIKEYLRDTPDFVRTIDSIRAGTFSQSSSSPAVTASCFVLSLDVISMYPSIPREHGAKAAANLWGRIRDRFEPAHPILPCHVEAIVLFILSHAIFMFNGHLYRQIKGTAMGSAMAVVFANALMGAFFQAFFVTYPQWIGYLSLFRRFLDDVFGFWFGSKATFDEFVTSLNSFSTIAGWGIQFDLTGWGKTVNYLDVEVFLYGNQWHTRLYYKPTDVHAYLDPTSNHPQYVHKNIPLGVAFRIRRLCSIDADFWACAKLFTDVFFTRRGYPRK